MCVCERVFFVKEMSVYLVVSYTLKAHNFGDLDLIFCSNEFCDVKKIFVKLDFEEEKEGSLL